MSHFDVMELFPTPLITIHIEEDTSELLKITNYTESVCDNYGEGKVQNDVNGKRLLEDYPHIRDMLLEKYKKVTLRNIIQH